MENRVSKMSKVRSVLDNSVTSLHIGNQEGCKGYPEGAGLVGHRYRGEAQLLVGGMEGYWSDDEGGRGGYGQHIGRGTQAHL